MLQMKKTLLGLSECKELFSGRDVWVIGNADNVKDIKLGEKIDKGVVVRINGFPHRSHQDVVGNIPGRFPLDAWEAEDIGSRTDVLYLNHRRVEKYDGELPVITMVRGGEIEKQIRGKYYQGTYNGWDRQEFCPISGTVALWVACVSGGKVNGVGFDCFKTPDRYTNIQPFSYKKYCETRPDKYGYERVVINKLQTEYGLKMWRWNEDN